MSKGLRRYLVALAAATVALPVTTAAQTLSQRGFVEARSFLFPQDAPNDVTNLVADVLARAEVFAKPAAWLQLAAGVDVRSNSHGQVERAWRVDFSDRTTRRPAISVRRLSATVHYRGLTLDAGKQFIRWGKTDIVSPTDHFAPRDFLDVVDSEFLGVTGVRAAVQFGADTIQAVVVPRFTPSRVPLLDQRWTAVPPAAQAIRLVDGGARLPSVTEAGVRWSHIGQGFESALSYFDGANHLPNIEAHGSFAPGELVVVRVYPQITSYGAELAVPTRWFTLKGEAAYFASSSSSTDEYLLYVIQLERQAGEWVFVGGYAGEVVTQRRALLTFAPDRGMTRSIVARASYSIDPNRSAAVETAVHQNGHGLYVKGEYSQARGPHWRVSAAGTVIAGRADDFLGQYHPNSHLSLSLRYSF